MARTGGVWPDLGARPRGMLPDVDAPMAATRERSEAGCARTAGDRAAVDRAHMRAQEDWRAANAYADASWDALCAAADPPLVTEEAAEPSTGRRVTKHRRAAPAPDIPLGQWLNDDGAVPMSQAKTHLSKLAAYANETGLSITVVRDGVPWIELRPLAHTDSRRPPAACGAQAGGRCDAVE